MTEISRSASNSIEQQLSEMSISQLFDLVQSQNENLAELGVTTSVSQIFYGAIAYGSRYEDRRYAGGGTIPTPLNCLMVVVHNQPSLKNLPDLKFERLATIVSGMSQAVQELVEKRGGFDWPASLDRSPQESIKQI